MFLIAVHHRRKTGAILQGKMCHVEEEYKRLDESSLMVDEVSDLLKKQKVAGLREEYADLMEAAWEETDVNDKKTIMQMIREVEAELSELGVYL